MAQHGDGTQPVGSARSIVEARASCADAELDPSGALLVGGGGDGLLRFWDASSGKGLDLNNLIIYDEDNLGRSYNSDEARRRHGKS